jgi:hypothetical protein
MLSIRMRESLSKADNNNSKDGEEVRREVE